MKQLRALACITVALAAALALPARSLTSSEDQKPEPETAGRYLILDTGYGSVKPMQKKLDKAAAAGFCVVSGVSGPEGNILVLEKDPTGKRHKYLFTDNFNRMLKKGDVKGYRVLPFTFDGGSAVLERLSEGEAQPEYHVLDTMRTSTFEKDMNEWAAKGFRLLALPGGSFGLMERVDGSPTSGPADQ